MSDSECTCAHRKRPEIEWQPYGEGFSRTVFFVPGYVCPVSGPRSHGRHGMEIVWALRSREGTAVSLAIMTDWFPDGSTASRGSLAWPISAGLSFHYRHPNFGDHRPAPDCWATGGLCFPDVSYMAGDEIVAAFVAEGEPAIWSELEKTITGMEAQR